LLLPALIPFQLLLVIAYPPPSTAQGYFDLIARDPLLALVSLDGLYTLDLLLASVVALAVAVAIGSAGGWLGSLAMLVNVAASAMYLSVNPTLALLRLSRFHAAATTELERSLAVSAGNHALLAYEGVVHDTSFGLAAAAGLMLGVAMLRSRVFDERTGYLGLVTNALALTMVAARVSGLGVAVLSIAPLTAWLVLVARRLLDLSHGANAGRQPPRRSCRPRTS
jgi:hypothetical protein